MPQQIHEAISTLEAKPVEGKPGRLKITLISPGQGSSGVYSQECLESAATDRVFAAGTHMYLDHPTATEKVDRPERSVRDLGAVLAEDAYWDADAGALVAEADTFSQHRDLLAEMQAHIGVSIRASADVEGAGRTRQITRLVEAQSVDFVTHAGRGGSFTVLESARPSVVNRRALRHDGVQEATVNDQREALDDVLKAAHGSDKVWVWLRDFDDTTAWFEISTDGTEATYSQTYETGNDGLATSMTGERTEVRQVTQYVPVSPAGSTTQESKEDTMATTQIEESELSDLRETAGRVSTLESERDTAISERDTARAQLAESKRTTRMDEILSEADHDFTPLEVKGLKGDAVVKENGDLDEAAFKTAVDEAVAQIAEANGAGSIRGNGRRQQTTSEVSESDLDAIDDAVFGEIKEG